MDDCNDSKVSTTIEIIANVASRVKHIFVDLVGGDDESISSSDVASSSDNESMKSTYEPVQVAPCLPNGNDKRVDSYIRTHEYT